MLVGSNSTIHLSQPNHHERRLCQLCQLFICNRRHLDLTTCSGYAGVSALFLVQHAAVMPASCRARGLDVAQSLLLWPVVLSTPVHTSSHPRKPSTLRSAECPAKTILPQPRSLTAASSCDSDSLRRRRLLLPQPPNR